MANQGKNRKQLRREQRKLKKVKRHEYYTNRNKPASLIEENNVNIVSANKVKNSVKNSPKKKIKQSVNASESTNEQSMIAKERKSVNKLQKEMLKNRGRQLLDANIEEDRNIKRLEKQLKLNKRKTKSVPKSFSTDGLDYLLEVCDSELMQNAVNSEKQLIDGNDDFDEDFELITGKKSSQKVNKDKKDDKLEESDSELDCDDEESENDEEMDELMNDLNSEDNSDINDENEEENDDLMVEDDQSDMEENNEDNSEKITEDIYGRLRDEKGNIVQENTVGKYIPPALRNKINDNSTENAKRLEKLKRLNKQLKGLLNRLAESNLHNISNQIETLYMNNSRNDMNDTLTNLILENVVMSVNSPERLLLEHVMLVTILHANVGTEVGAHFLQRIVNLFHTTSSLTATGEIPVEDKTLDNICAVISQLYNFKVFHCQLLYQLLHKLTERFEEEKHVECILLVLKQVGFTLRKDDPVSLKTLILQLQKQAAIVMNTVKDNARITFMLDILLAIKNNNVSKIPNYDTTYAEHLKKLLKGFIRKGYYVTQLNISLDDLLKADQNGKWWVVGSAWTGTGTADSSKPDVGGSTPDTITPHSDRLLTLARKQRMNTDTRRNVFCILMSAEDYLDAFEKLLHLGLKNQQEREIIHVILHCCLQEKKFNNYYAVLCNKFCDYDRKFQMMIKYSIWDKLKTLSDCSGAQISNLAKLLTHLFLEKSLALSTLKIMHFNELDKVTLRFTRQILLGVLLSDDLEKCQEVFLKVTHSEQLKMFRESLRLFIHHFLIKNISDKLAEKDVTRLKERAEIIDKLLAASNKKVHY